MKFIYKKYVTFCLFDLKTIEIYYITAVSRKNILDNNEIL